MHGADRQSVGDTRRRKERNISARSNAAIAADAIQADRTTRGERSRPERTHAPRSSDIGFTSAGGLWSIDFERRRRWKKFHLTSEKNFCLFRGMYGFVRLVRFRRFIAPLLAAMMFFAVAAARSNLVGHMDVGLSNHSPTICQSAASGEEAPAQDGGIDCCDACALSFAPGLVYASISSFVLRLELATRLYFVSLFGDPLDAGPDDLRSRAPPFAA